MGPPGYQVEAAVLGLDALNLPAPVPLVLHGQFDGDPLDRIVTNHRGEVPVVPLRVRNDPPAAEMLDVGHGAVAFQLDLPATVQAVVQVLKRLFSLRSRRAGPDPGKSNRTTRR